MKLNDLAELIAKLGSAAGLILFIALMIRFFVQLGTNNPERSANEKGIAFVQILIISVTLIVVAVPEGKLLRSVPWLQSEQSQVSLSPSRSRWPLPRSA